MARTIFGIIFTLAIITVLTTPALNWFLHQFGFVKLNAASFAANRLCFWAGLGLVFLFTIAIEKKPVLLWKDQDYDAREIFISVVALIGAIVIGLIIVRLIVVLAHADKKSPALTFFIDIFKKNPPLMLFTILTAGVVEEILFRGYLQPRFELLFKNPIPGIVITSILFGLSHWGYGTLANMLGPFVIGLIFAIYYYKFRNIKVLMIAHFLWDLMAIFLAIRFIH